MVACNWWDLNSSQVSGWISMAYVGTAVSASFLTVPCWPPFCKELYKELQQKGRKTLIHLPITRNCCIYQAVWWSSLEVFCTWTTILAFFFYLVSLQSFCQSPAVNILFLCNVLCTVNERLKINVLVFSYILMPLQFVLLCYLQRRKNQRTVFVYIC